MPDKLNDSTRKRQKAKGREVPFPLMLIEMKRELESRIFKLEERVKFLESRDESRGLSGMIIGGL